MNPAELVRDGLVTALLLVLPLALAAAGASVLVGLAAARFGLRDPVLVTIARAAAVLAVLLLGGGRIGDELVALTRGLWAGLGEI